jgi:hypothetical protein
VLPPGRGPVLLRRAEGRTGPAQLELARRGRPAGRGDQGRLRLHLAGQLAHVGRVEALVTDLHAVNSSLVDNGFGPQLLCTLVAFSDEQERRLALIYLYKRGSFYPFAPLSGERRNNALELEIKGVIGDDLKWEPDLARWFPVWGAPGL